MAGNSREDDQIPREILLPNDNESWKAEEEDMLCSPKCKNDKKDFASTSFSLHSPVQKPRGSTSRLSKSLSQRHFDKSSKTNRSSRYINMQQVDKLKSLETGPGEASSITTSSIRDEVCAFLKIEMQKQKSKRLLVDNVADKVKPCAEPFPKKSVCRISEPMNDSPKASKSRRARNTSKSGGKSKSMRNLNIQGENASRSSPNALKRRSHSTRNLYSNSNRKEKQGFTSPRANNKMDFLPPLLGEEEIDEEQTQLPCQNTTEKTQSSEVTTASTDNGVAVDESIVPLTTAGVSKRSLLRTQLLRIDAKLGAILASMQNTRRKIDMMEFNADTYSEASDTESISLSDDEDDESSWTTPWFENEIKEEQRLTSLTQREAKHSFIIYSKSNHNEKLYLYNLSG